MAQYIISSTFSVDQRLHGKWLALITDHYIPFLKKEGFEQITFAKLLNNDNDSHTYSLQMRTDSVLDFNRYSSEVFGEYLQIASPLFGDSVLYFNSVLKVVECE